MVWLARYDSELQVYGMPDGIKLIPVGNIAAKDESVAIKGITAQMDQNYLGVFYISGGN